MRRTILLLVMMAPLLFAQGGENVKYALEELEETSRTFLLISSVVQLVIGAVLFGVAIFIYMKKLKGVKEKGLLWIIAALILGVIGLLLLLGAVLGFLTFLFAPTMIQGMTGA